MDWLYLLLAGAFFLGSWGFVKFASNLMTGDKS
jgi:hypothetical protein